MINTWLQEGEIPRAKVVAWLIRSLAIPVNWELSKNNLNTLS